MDCIFCKIASKEIPADIVYEDDQVIAFRDAHPQMPVHVLVIPKAHHENLGDAVGEELMGHLFSRIPQVASLLGVDKEGYRVIVNVGENAGQTVFHLHVHILGGQKMSEQMIKA